MSLTNIIMKSKGALPVIVMHNGFLHWNDLIVYLIFFYVHSSQHHLHFHSAFSENKVQVSVPTHKCVK